MHDWWFFFMAVLRQFFCPIMFPLNTIMIRKCGSGKLMLYTLPIPRMNSLKRQNDVRACVWCSRCSNDVVKWDCNMWVHWHVLFSDPKTQTLNHGMPYSLYPSEPVPESCPETFCNTFRVKFCALGKIMRWSQGTQKIDYKTPNCTLDASHMISNISCRLKFVFHA